MNEEEAFWGDCVNTYHEETKQQTIASRLGLYATTNCAHPPTYILGGRSVIDIGGGPVSLLLKCVDMGRAVVADPGSYPDWVTKRYEAHGVEYWKMNGEDIAGYTFDEAWIYNCLQHVIDPEKVVSNSLLLAKTVRIFEYIDIPPYPGHPHELRRDDLDKWFNGMGYVADINESGVVGKVYYGCFSSKRQSTTQLA